MDYGFIIKGMFLQIMVFTIIPFFYWLIKYHKEVGFFSWLGFKMPQTYSKKTDLGKFIAIYFIVYGIVHFSPISEIVEPSASKYVGLGFVAIIPCILVCFFQQGLAEEILFRGFLGKRFISKLGMKYGNILQAICFGLMHVLLFINNEKNLIAYVIIFISTSIGGWLLGYLNEEFFKGSIIPSIVVHGAGNFIMNMSVAF